jgi:hypothetical protein
MIETDRDPWAPAAPAPFLLRARNVVRRKARFWFSRWPVAHLLNRSPRFCWSDLAMWANTPRRERRGGDHRLGYTFTGAHCREESRTHRDQSCWCGKFVAGACDKTDVTKED